MSLDRKREKKQSKNCDTPKEFAPLLANNVEYSLTINPLNQYEESSSRYLDVYSSLVTFLKKHKLREFCYLYLITEVSYPLMNGVGKRKPSDVTSRIHFHGTITFTDVVKWFIYVQPFLASFCVYEIDMINDEKVWNSYINKDYKVWSQSFLVYPDEDMTPHEDQIEAFTSYVVTNKIVRNSKVKRKKKTNRLDEIIDEVHPLLVDENQCQFYCEVDDPQDPINQSHVSLLKDDEKNNESFVPNLR